jgi:hypothetical protein
MNFQDLLLKLHEERTANESVAKTGESEQKERAKGSSADIKAKDAARKRIERARQVPREKKSPSELVKEIVAVKTKSGNLQLIFKDSYNSGTHTKLTEKEMSLGDANKIASDPNFEQTRASKLLLGDVKGKKEEKESQVKKPEEVKQKKEEKPQEGGEQQKVAPAKARRLSKEEIMAQMSQMTPEQLATVPLELRQEYFQSLRRPPENREFDHTTSSYEELTVRFGINQASNIPYNQQVLNALMFLAKLKVGASEQELQSYQIQAPAAMEFTKAAFAQAKKVLSQLGDTCLSALVSNIESNSKQIESAGATDMQCGDYRFKVSAGGEIALSTNSFDQSNKSFRGFLAGALTKNLQTILQNPNTPKAQEVAQQIQTVASEFSDTLVSKQSLPIILSNENYVKQLQQTPVLDIAGNQIGTILDAEGNLNPQATYENYTDKLSRLAKPAVKLLKSDKSTFNTAVSADLLKTVLRGDGIKEPGTAPTHIITMNGVFPITDNYINEISKVADLEVHPAKDVINTNNIDSYKASAANKMKDYRTIVESKIKQPSLKELLIAKGSVDPSQVIASAAVNQFDFNFNASLLPGFKPKDLNTVEYNYVTIGKKTIKIPVMSSDQPTVSQMMMSEQYEFLNDVILEGMTNNFVLSSLAKSQLINEIEANVIYNGPVTLLESSEATLINFKSIIDNIMERVSEDPSKLDLFIDDMLFGLDEEYKRDYKKEYRNYHGKAKQRKERAARTRARELMKKKGIVKKGDGKDIDHKRPLRSGGSNGINNLRVRKKSDNRSDNGHRKGEKQNKDWE